MGGNMVVNQGNPPAAALASHMDTGANAEYSTSDAASCLRPGEAEEDGARPWDPAPRWET